MQKACGNASVNITNKLNAIVMQLQSVDAITSKRDIDTIKRCLEELLANLPGPLTVERLVRLDDDIYIDWKTIAQNEYASALDSVLRLIDNDWPGDDRNAHNQLLKLFAIDDNHEFGIESISALAISKNIGKYPFIVEIIESLVTSPTYFCSLFTHLSYEKSTNGANLRENQIVQYIVSLPSIVANQLHGKIPNCFMLETYSGFLLTSILKTIHFIAESKEIFRTSTFNGQFLSKLLSRILIDFNLNHTSPVLPKLIHILGIWSIKSESCCGIIRTVLLHLNRQAIDVISTYLLASSHMDSMLGDNILLSSDWRYCFNVKLPLLSCLKDDRMIINLARYLAGHSEKADLYKLFIEMLKAWSSKISTTSHTYDQHLYLTKLILSSNNLFALPDVAEQVENIKRTLFRGVQNHIESMSPQMRVIGMITGELICNRTARSDEDKLLFDFSSCSEAESRVISQLREIADCKNAEEKIEFEVDDEEMAIQDLFAIITSTQPKAHVSVPQRTSVRSGEEKQRETVVLKTKPTEGIMPLDEDDLDSDDDLEPTDMSHDVAQKHDSAPKYLVDLRENLLETDDPDVFEVSLETCAQLITEKLPNDDCRIGLELLKILIDLECKFAMDNFYACRTAGCIAICCIIPKEGAEYLCQEFHSEASKYSISKKVLMLEILSETAKALSRISKPEPPHVLPQTAAIAAPKKLIDLKDDSKRLDDAKRIIRERVERKTRRFAHKTINPQLNAQRNRFADVAGHFFFPLLYGFGKQQLAITSATSSLKYDTDNVLLVTFLNTVATVIFAAQNCPIATKFGPEVFSISSVLRFHAEPKVRLGVLYIIAATFMVAPKDSLLAYSFNDICEVRAWLEQMLSLNILSGEKDTECREMAKHVLALCIDVLS